jgi:hypothetical protein
MNAAVEARIQVVDNHYTACKAYIDRLHKLQGDITVQQELAALVRDQVRTFAHVVQVLVIGLSVLLLHRLTLYRRVYSSLLTSRTFNLLDKPCSIDIIKAKNSSKRM